MSEWNRSDDNLPVVGQEVEISFTDCCVNGTMTGVVSHLEDDEDTYPDIVLHNDSKLSGHFSWRVI